jgi:hypothetical protein
MSLNATRPYASCALLASAMAWPWVAGSLAGLFATPFERALQTAWCGVAPHDALTFLGHCPACWVDAAILFSAACAAWPQRAAAKANR